MWQQHLKKATQRWTVTTKPSWTCICIFSWKTYSANFKGTIATVWYLRLERTRIDAWTDSWWTVWGSVELLKSTDLTDLQASRMWWSWEEKPGIPSRRRTDLSIIGSTSFSAGIPSTCPRRSCIRLNTVNGLKKQNCVLLLRYADAKRSENKHLSHHLMSKPFNGCGDYPQS